MRHDTEHHLLLRSGTWGEDETVEVHQVRGILETGDMRVNWESLEKRRSRRRGGRIWCCHGTRRAQLYNVCSPEPKFYKGYCVYTITDWHSLCYVSELIETFEPFILGTEGCFVKMGIGLPTPRR